MSGRSVARVTDCLATGSGDAPPGGGEAGGAPVACASAGIAAVTSAAQSGGGGEIVAGDAKTFVEGEPAAGVSHDTTSHALDLGCEHVLLAGRPLSTAGDRTTNGLVVQEREARTIAGGARVSEASLEPANDTTVPRRTPPRAAPSPLAAPAPASAPAPEAKGAETRCEACSEDRSAEPFRPLAPGDLWTTPASASSAGTLDLAPSANTYAVGEGGPSAAASASGAGPVAFGLDPRSDASALALGSGAPADAAPAAPPFSLFPDARVMKPTISLDPSCPTCAGDHRPLPAPTNVPSAYLPSAPNVPLFSASEWDETTPYPKPDEVKQGGIGDCYFLSGVGSVAASDPQNLLNRVKDNGDGTSSVTFDDPKAPGGKTNITVTNDVPRTYIQPYINSGYRVEGGFSYPGEPNAVYKVTPLIPVDDASAWTKGPLTLSSGINAVPSEYYAPMNGSATTQDPFAQAAQMLGNGYGNEPKVSLTLSSGLAAGTGDSTPQTIDGKPFYVSDNRAVNARDSSAQYVQVMEKAYAEFKGGGQGYAGIGNGGNVDDVYRALGYKPESYYSFNADKDWSALQSASAAGNPVSASTGSEDYWDYLSSRTKLLHYLSLGMGPECRTCNPGHVPRDKDSGHAITVLRAFTDADGNRMVTLDNPWNTAGGTNGTFTESYDDFKHDFVGFTVGRK